MGQSTKNARHGHCYMCVKLVLDTFQNVHFLCFVPWKNVFVYSFPSCSLLNVDRDLSIGFIRESRIEVGTWSLEYLSLRPPFATDEFVPSIVYSISLSTGYEPGLAQWIQNRQFLRIRPFTA